MFRFILVFTITLILLFVTAVSYRSSLDKYSQYFVNQKSSKSLYKAVYLGTSSILITDGKTTILTDGFITRPSIYSLLFTKIEPNKELIKKALKKIGIRKIDAIITLHSHHDHAMDSAIVAQQTGAFLIGSSSTANISKSHGFTNIKGIEEKKSFQIGDFKITVIPSQHSHMGKYLGKVVGLGEEITNKFKTPSYFTNYKEAKTYALLVEHKKGNVFINGSTNFIKGSLETYQAQTVFLGIAKLTSNSKEFQEEYFNGVAKTLNAKRVIPIHWDDFTVNIFEDTKPMPRVFDDFDASMDFLIKQSYDNNMKLQLLRIFDTIDLNK